ncbi:MarR family transcriptional regulator [Streptococcus vicugnae]|uniref:MarR family transcriptional regulator n=1 Tax=Streptococcus vicugnae TaxID=2740579 RepID=A0A4R5G3L4_9STRE|nr:MarR family transcriptional regulator [Streptococcus vicugnae]TDE71035.1 MarR family transcriptional regulator [Streptococcus vicugnae]
MCKRDRCLFFSIKRLDRALDKYTEEAFRKIGMSHSYALVLFILNQENGKCYKELANILCIAPPSLTKIIDKLASREFVTIARDGRTKRVYITDRGRELAPIIWEVFHDTRQELMKTTQTYDLATIIDQINSFSFKN